MRGVIGLAPARVIVDEALAEFDYGAWEGLVEAEIDERFPGERARREADKWHYQVPGGESYAQLAERLEAWLGGQADMPQIVVAHEMVNRVLRGLYLGLGSDEILRLSHPQTRIYLLANGAALETDLSVAA
jgi:broad specificity phosphatase PhoE